jgi:hypothetical protein
MPLQCFTEMILIFLTRTATIVGVRLFVVSKESAQRWPAE